MIVMAVVIHLKGFYDDNDGYADPFDSCPVGIIGFLGNDYDADGCKDDEDLDDDNDGVTDDLDGCATGDLDWVSSGVTDHDRMVVMTHWRMMMMIMTAYMICGQLS